MSDGPHRSLGMRRGWRVLAERADVDAYSSDECVAAIPKALLDDWEGEGCGALLPKLVKVVRCPEGLLGDERLARLEGLERDASLTVLQRSFVEATRCELEQNEGRDVDLSAVVEDLLTDVCARAAKNIEEHYLRESNQHRAANVRSEIESAFSRTPLKELARSIVRGEGRAFRRVEKKSDVDDGVDL